METYSSVETSNSTHFSSVRRTHGVACENTDTEGFMPETKPLLYGAHSNASDLIESNSELLDGCSSASPSWRAFAGHPYSLNVRYMGGEFEIAMEREGVCLTEPLRFRELEFLHRCGSEYTARFITLLLQSPRALQFVDRVLHKLRGNKYVMDFERSCCTFLRVAYMHLMVEVTDKGTWSFEDLVRAVDDAAKVGFFEYSSQSQIPFNEQCLWEIFCQTGATPREELRRKHRAIFDVREIIPQIQQRELTSRQLNRLRREAIQRQARKDDAEALRKSVPKVQREKFVRKKRRQARESQLPIEEQSGGRAINWKKLSHQDRSKLAQIHPQGLGRVISFPFRMVKHIAAIPIRLARALHDLQRLLDPDNKDSRLNRSLDKASTALDTITNTVKEVRNSLRHHVPRMLLQTILAGFVFFLFKNFDSPLLRLAMLGVAGLMFGPAVKAMLDELFHEDQRKPDVAEEDGKIELQSGEEDTSLLAKIIGTVMLTVMVGAKKVSNFGGLVTSMVTVLGHAPRALKGIDVLVDAVVSMTEAGVNFIRTKVGMSPVKFSDKWAKLIGDLGVRVRGFEHEIDSGACKLTAAQIYTKCMGFLREIQTQMEIHSFNRALKSELNQLKAIAMRLAWPHRQTVGQGIGYRHQPASLLVAGKPGLGKTTIMQALCLTVMKMTGDVQAGCSAQEASQAVFVKPLNSPYMDGYNGQYAYLIDDLFQLKPQPGEEATGFHDIMTYYGSFTAMLNMAECEKKGMFPFHSKLMVMTTNVENLEQCNASAILVSPDAFKRRIDFHVVMQVKPRFRKENSAELDFRSFALEQEATGRYPWHIWEWMPTTFGGLQTFPPGSGRPMSELLEMVARKILDNGYYHTKQMDMMEEIINDTDLEGFRDRYNAPRPSAEEVEARREANIALQSGSSCPDLEPIDDLEETVPEEPLPVVKPVWVVEPDAPLLLEEDYESWESRRLYNSPREKAAREERERRESMAKWKRNAHNWACGVCHHIQKVVNESAYQGFVLGVQVMAMIYAAPSVIRFIKDALKAGFNLIKSLIFGRTKVKTQSNHPKPRVVRFVQQQSGGAPPKLWHIVYENTYKMCVEVKDGEFDIQGQVLFLKEACCVMPAHFLEELKMKLNKGIYTNNTQVYFRGCSQSNKRIVMSVGALFSRPANVLKDNDLAFVDFQNTVNHHRNIMKHLLTDAELNDSGGATVRLDTARMESDGELTEYNERISFFSPSMEVIRSDVTIGPVRHKRVLRYHAETTPGDCGAVLTISEHSHTACRCIAGLHVGKMENMPLAYSTPLTREVVEKGISHFRFKEIPEMNLLQSGGSHLGVSMLETDASAPNMPNVEGMTVLGQVDRGVSQPIASKLRRTQLGAEEFFKEQIFDFYGEEPARLQVMKLGSYRDEEGNVKYPMKEALQPFTTETRVVDTTKFSRAVGVAMQRFNVLSRNDVARILTFEEAVLGVPALGLKSIARSTSAGFPWCIEAKDKKYFFGSDPEGFDLENPNAVLLKEQVMELVGELEAGKRPFFVCRDFLKDETRKVGKNARLIAGTDIRYYIICRMYFGAYCASLMKHHTKSGVCTGMNQYAEWGTLRQHLERVGDKFWDGDFGGFDSSQMPGMLWCLLKEMNNWYNHRGESDGSKIREILFMDLAHSRHIASYHGVATTIVQWEKSLPSGHFLTSTVNSMLSLTLIAYVFIHVTGELDFWANAAAATQGDDNLCAVSDDYCHLFNQVTVAQVLWDEFRMVYTAGRKGEALVEYKKLEDLIFLQRQFAVKRNIEGVLVDVCPLRPESFLHSLYYVKESQHVRAKETIQSGLELALEELAMHSEEMWHKTAPRIVEAMRLYSWSPRSATDTSALYLDTVLKRVPDYV